MYIFRLFHVTDIICYCKSPWLLLYFLVTVARHYRVIYAVEYQSWSIVNLNFL